MKDILFAIGDGYQIQSPKCTLFHHPRNQDCESSRPECLDLLQRTCTHPYFLTCLNSCFRIQGGTECCSINFYSINPFDKNAYSAFTIHNSVRHFHTFRWVYIYSVGITSSLILSEFTNFIDYKCYWKTHLNKKVYNKTLIKIGRHKNTVSNKLYLMLWCDIWEWILYLWNAKNYLQTLETFLEKYLKLFKNKVVLQVINHQSNLLKKKLLIILYSTNHCQ